MTYNITRHPSEPRIELATCVDNDIIQLNRLQSLTWTTATRIDDISKKLKADSSRHNLEVAIAYLDHIVVELCLHDTELTNYQRSVSAYRATALRNLRAGRL